MNSSTVPPRRDGTHDHAHGAAPYMPTAIDVFAKVRGHERAEQLRAAREADLLPYFRRARGPGGAGRGDGGRRADHARLQQLPRADRRRARDAGRARRARALRHRPDRLAPAQRHARPAPRARGASSPSGWAPRRRSSSRPATRPTSARSARSSAPGDTVIADSGDHASILDGCLLSRAKLRPFRHNRLDKLEKMLERAGDDGGGVLVVVDGVFSMEGDVAPLPRDRRAVRRRYGARLMVDEAHGAGVLGARGAGASRAARRRGPTSTCGWARSRSRSPPAAASSPARTR